MENQRVLTVTQVNEYIKYLLESAPVLKSVTVQGEISNYNNHPSGHRYFSLKDQTGTIHCVMFRSSAARLRFVPENGMKVLATGHVSSFPRDGQYQLYCDSMVPDGAGALAIAFEQLKRKLQAEGLFDTQRKKPLPSFPRRIGIITSPSGAAVRDMIQVTGRRYPMADLVLFPALVQGEGAAPQLAEGIAYFNRTQSADVIIIGRGGGSVEDLWAFNDETLVRAVAGSTIPVISAVGHETDFTLCDFAADMRAPTPSAAAELAVPDQGELGHRMNQMQNRMCACLGERISRYRQIWDRLTRARVLTSPLASLEEKRTLLLSEERAMLRAMQAVAQRKQQAYTALTAQLQALNPLSVITRGYAAVFDEHGGLVRSVGQIKEGQTLSLRLGDGSVDTRVQKIKPSEPAKEKTI